MARACAARSSHALEEAYSQKEASVGPQVMRYLEKEVTLRTLDQHWREHLAAMDYMRQGIFLRSYAQKNPKQEYKREAFELFSAMLDRIKFDTRDARFPRSRSAARRRSSAKSSSASSAWRAHLQMQHAEAPSADSSPADGAGGDATAAAALGSIAGLAGEHRRRTVRTRRCPRWGAMSLVHVVRGASSSTATVLCKPTVELHHAAHEVHVLAGVIFDAAPRVLIAQRRRGKDLSGYWEFPGGKIEPGETRHQALARELREELGIDIFPARPLHASGTHIPPRACYWISGS